MMQAKTLFFLILLGVTIIVATTLKQDVSDSQNATAVLTTNSYYLEDFELIALDGNGVQTYSVEGEKLEQSSSSGVSQIAHPASALYKDGVISWRIRSEEGTISDDQSHITLTNRVVAQNIRDQDIHIETKSLDIFLNENRIVTDETVTITHQAGTLSGRGMEADLTNNSIQLKADIKGTYDP